jgi:hypothetical protein
MKSNKQRRAEIVARRLARADRLRVQMKTPQDARGFAVQPGCVPADTVLLARLNNSYGLPSFYLDRPFTCRDCGAQAVWTAKQQKWWYEVVRAHIDSRAVRCLPCRRARRTALAASRAAPGANRLGDEVAWLRAVSAAPPDAQTEARVEAALRSKWDGVRKVAIEVLGRWRRPADLPRLREWAHDESLGRWSAVRRAAAEALAATDNEKTTCRSVKTTNSCARPIRSSPPCGRRSWRSCAPSRHATR